MAKEKELSQRDVALISILERFGNQIQQYDEHLDEITKRQSELSGILERTEQRSNVRQNITEAALEELKKEFTRYRSDMFAIVSEQDRLDESMQGLGKQQKMIAEVQEEISGDIANLDERFTGQEKAAHEHYESAQKQFETVFVKIEESDRQQTELHMDTEKRLIEERREYKHQVETLRQELSKRMLEEHSEHIKQIETLRNDMTKRLLALEGIESALQVLMVRTEPPEKKPMWIKRLFRRVGLFFRKIGTKISRVFSH